MTAPRSGVVYWLRCQMRALDRWCGKAIFFLCMFGIAAHGLLGNHVAHR